LRRELALDRSRNACTAPGVSTFGGVTRKILPYDKTRLGQATGYFCGPATTQVLLSARGQIVDESTLAAELGTDQDGTDYIGLLEKVLTRRLGVPYRSVYLASDPPSSGQVEAFWASLRRSIDGGYGVAMNWVVPPGNRPRGVLGSQSPSYPGSTVYHYVAALGYNDDAKAVWVVDSGFWPREYWCSLAQVATLIPPKGYAYADVSAPAPPVALPPPPPTPELSRADRYALAIINEGKRRGVSPRGQKICLATGLVESNLTKYANSKVPESLKIPHDAVGSDGYSVGIMQQQVVMENGRWWWGDVATCMDPTKSAGLFYDRLVKLNYNDLNRSPGSFAQDVQRSAYPGRYDERYTEAEQLYNRLAAIESADPLVELLMLKIKSMSIYADPGEDPIPADVMLAAIDAHGPHEPWVEDQARAGNAKELARVVRTALGKGQFGDEPRAVNQAIRVLAEIDGKSFDEMKQLIGKGALS
jgi:hypothetical protein